MRNKIMVIGVFLAVMLSMTGIAAALETQTTCQWAFSLQLYDKEGNTPYSWGERIELKPNEELNLSLRMSGNYDPFQTFQLVPVAWAVPGKGGQNSDITVALHPNILTPNGQNPYIQKDTITVKLSPNSPFNAEYNVIIAACDGQQFGITIGHFVSIPEFQTIAMPIAAVIGLMFFFHRRKLK